MLPKDSLVSFAGTSITEVVMTGKPEFTSDLALEREFLLRERKLLEVRRLLLSPLNIMQ
jgi:hypothetical protein